MLPARAGSVWNSCLISAGSLITTARPKIGTLTVNAFP